MFSLWRTANTALEENTELADALKAASLSTKERTDEVQSYPHGAELINMMIDVLSKSDELPHLEALLIHICRLFKKRAPQGEYKDAEYTQLLLVMQQIYKSYALSADACKVIFGDLAVDGKLGQLSEMLDLLMPLTQERLAAVMKHAETLVAFYEKYKYWEMVFESLPTLTPLRECAFANFLETYTLLCDAYIILDKNRISLLNNYDYFAAMWVLDKCGVIFLRKTSELVNNTRLELSEKIARLLMTNGDMCTTICKYAATHCSGDAKLSDEEIDQMSEDLTNMIFTGIKELKGCIGKAFQQHVFDRGSSLMKVLRESQVKTLVKRY